MSNHGLRDDAPGRDQGGFEQEAVSLPYQRNTSPEPLEAPRGTTETHVRDLQARRTLSARATTGIRSADALPATFFLTCAAVFLARLQNQSVVVIDFDGRPLRLEVELARPFSDLLLDLAARLEGPDGFRGSGEQLSADSVEAVAALHLVPAGQQPEHLPRLLTAGMQTASPAFLVQLTDHGWDLVVDAPGWTKQTAERNVGYLAALVESAAANREQPAGTLKVATEAEALARYAALNRTARPLPGKTVLDLVSESVLAFGRSDAVRFGDARLSYAELEEESTTLANQLRARGADQQHPVAICMRRSERMPVVLLATLKAGSYFVPLDPSHPKQRLIDVLQECAPAIVVVSAETRALLAETGLPLLEPGTDVPVASGAGAMACSLAPGDKAYMIYTSGTTGRPKGVMIQHRALLNFILAMRERPGLEPGDRLLAVATLSFDMSILDTFLPLSSGATLVIASEQAARDPWELAKIFETQAITCMQATPVTWRMLLSSGYRGHAGLKMLVGGEALGRDLANELAPIGRELWNCYGPTETTVYSSVLRIDKRDGPQSGPVTLGPPLANTAFYVADAAGNLLPPEMAGELYIGGAGVAAGYFERPELNRERFLRDPWTASNEADEEPAKMFRTGDQVRLAAQGRNEFEFFGRLDQQVKLRGYRIELGEIEAVLRADAAVADAAVLLREDAPGEPWLVGYVTTAGTENAPPVKALLEHAARQLPAYMLPSRIVGLASLPLTGSGKVDKRALAALPAPAEQRDEPPMGGTAGNAQGDGASLNTLEAALLKIFRDTLRSQTFGPDDNFFEHGGYSMMALRLFARIGTTLHKQLPITALFDAPTVRRLAELIHRGDRLQALVPIRPTGSEAPFFLVHSYLLYGAARVIVEAGRPVYGLRERSATSATLDLQRCVADYAEAIHRASPSGTVHLGGWCAAATLTIELARRLMAQGRKVGMVALFDADAPGFVPVPPKGSRWFAKLRAMRTFHLGRMQGLTWRERLDYLSERLKRAPLNLVERFYARYHARIDRWQHSFRWLPSAIFYNRFMQIGHLQAERMEELEVRIQLFRARDVPTIQGSDEALGWGAVGRRGVDVVLIPGHHESMFLEPNLEVLRRKFQASMRHAESELAQRQLART